MVVRVFVVLISLLLLCGFTSSEPETSQPDPETPLQTLDYKGDVQISTAKKYKIVTQSESLFIYGAPYNHRTNGEYILQDSIVNGYPVYQKNDTAGTTWSFYRRSNGNWFLDFDTPGEDWGGTVMYSTTAGPSPFLLEYSGGIVIPHNKLFTQLMPYHNGEYTCEGQVYNNAPVFKAAETFQSYQFHVYKRQNGKWYVDFDAINEDWSGTVAYTLQPAKLPYDVEWN